MDIEQCKGLMLNELIQDSKIELRHQERDATSDQTGNGAVVIDLADLMARNVTTIKIQFDGMMRACVTVCVCHRVGWCECESARACSIGRYNVA